MPDRVIPAEWLRGGHPKRVICHWTGGAYTVSELDREHYHIIVGLRGGKLDVARGDHSIADNDHTGDDDYAAHTRVCNTGSIGLAVACMAGAVKGNGGKFPLTELLLERLAQAAAECCHAYGIPVTATTVLQHGEVEKQLGISQRGKWDVCWWSFAPELSAVECCEKFRKKVTWYLERLG